MNVVEYSVEPLLRVAQAFGVIPRVMAELGRLMREPNSDLGEITVHLKRDSALAGRLLRVANSAAFAQSGRVGTVEQASALIGYAEIHRLVGAMAVDQFSQSSYPLYGFPGWRLRKNALFVALLMEVLAGESDVAPSVAYTVGLFRCFGRLALEKVAAEMDPAEGFRADYDHDLVLWEKHTFGITGNDATAVILRHWQFPRNVGDAIAAHYAARNREPLAQLLHLAAGMADDLDHGLPGEKRYWGNVDEAYRQCGLNPADRPTHIDRTMTAFARMNRAIE